MQIVLLHSPLVGPGSVTPTARALEAAGAVCITPNCHAGDQTPAWRDLPAHLLGALPDVHAPVIVGHSMAGLLAGRLANALDAAAVICLDANMPPETGPTPTVEPSFLEFLKRLPLDDEGRLPPWHKWWPVDAFEGAVLRPEQHAALVAEIPRLKLNWFDDAFDMPSWSNAKRGFIRTGAWFDQEADKAVARGWPVIRLQGTHLHCTFRPQETADAILRCITQMGLGKP